jgi:hypothetical protein
VIFAGMIVMQGVVALLFGAPAGAAALLVFIAIFAGALLA